MLSTFTFVLKLILIPVVALSSWCEFLVSQILPAFRLCFLSPSTTTTNNTSTSVGITCYVIPVKKRKTLRTRSARPRTEKVKGLRTGKQTTTREHARVEKEPTATSVELARETFPYYQNLATAQHVVAVDQKADEA